MLMSTSSECGVKHCFTLSMKSHKQRLLITLFKAAEQDINLRETNNLL